MTVVNLESLSPEQEVRQDLLAIIAFHPDYMACVVIKKKLRKLFRNPIRILKNSYEAYRHPLQRDD
jgi:hypothetical protein